MGERVTLSIREGIADVRLSRPDKANALDPAMFDALIAAGEDLKRAKGVRAAVLSGEGRGFCAGIDMGILAEIKDSPVAGVKDLAARTHGVCNRFQYAAWIWREVPVPVIAAVHGFALGGGLQVALGTDIRYVTPDARLSIMEVKWGLVPDMGGTLTMRPLVRDDLLRELSYTGRIFSGLDAVTYGFATRTEKDPLAAAMETAREIAGRSPDAIRALKRLMNGEVTQAVRAGLIAESVEQQGLNGSFNQMETVHASRENRAPRFVDS